MRITSVEMNGVDIVDDTLQGRAQVHADKYAAERGYKVHKVHDVCEAGYKVHFSQGGNTWDEAVFFSTT